MDFPTPSFLLALPLCIAAMALAFAASWWFALRTRSDVLWVAAAYGLFAVVLGWQLTRSDLGALPWEGAAVYVAAASMLGRGVCLRYRVRHGGAVAVALGLAVVAGRAALEPASVFHLERIYLLNFGMGAAMLLPSWRLARLRPVHRLDCAVLLLFLAIGLSFFVRTGLTVPWPWGGAEAPVFARGPFWLSMQLSMLLAALAFAWLLMAANVRDLLAALRFERNHDALTGLLNRRGFDEAARVRLSSSHAGRHALVVCDVDRFKEINDRHGHAEGDAVLRHLGQLLRRSARREDTVGRYGGEEFVLLVREHGATQSALALAKRIQALVGAQPPTVRGRLLPLTLSFGVTALRAEEPLEVALARADLLLYRAKEEGRDRVCADAE